MKKFIIAALLALAGALYVTGPALAAEPVSWEYSANSVYGSTNTSVQVGSTTVVQIPAASGYRKLTVDNVGQTTAYYRIDKVTTGVASNGLPVRPGARVEIETGNAVNWLAENKFSTTTLRIEQKTKS